MRVINITPGLLPIPPNGWGAVEKIIWEYHQNLLKLGHDSSILYLDDIKYELDTIVHIHVANLAIEAHKRGIPYYFTCHDHHAYLYGKESSCFRQNYEAIKHSICSFVPAKYLVDYFSLPNLYYLSHGVNTEIFKPIQREISEYKLLCVANNGFFHNSSEDRKGFSLAIDSARELNMSITIAGPENNKNFFEKYNVNYEKLTVLYNLKEIDLIGLYQLHDIFLHPSILEAGHPNLTLLEAMSCGLPVIGTFEENNNLEGLLKIKRNTQELINGIKKVVVNYDEYKELALSTATKKTWFNIVKQLIGYYKNNMKDQLLDIYRNTSLNYIKHKEPDNNIVFDFNNKAKIEICGDILKNYSVKFFNKKNNTLIYESNITNNMWAQVSPVYFIDWNIKVFDQNQNSVILDFNLDLSNKNVKIVNESPSMGDCISWIPYVDLFQKTHKCVLDFYTPNKDLFESEYPNINFFNYNHISDTAYYASYKIGCFDPTNTNLSPKDYRTQNLQEIAANILGFDYTEIKTKVCVKYKERKLDEKYVCISTASTAGCKHWQNENGWQQTVDYLNSLGYKVVVIQKEDLNYMDLKSLKNVIHPKTTSIHDAISWLYNCEFFIGLSSGNSWLAWALNKKVIMISGFTKSFNEFFTPNRIKNESACNGCWNDTNYKFDPGDWNWCPVHKNTNRQFECTKTIDFNYVKRHIDNILYNEPLMKNFDEHTYKEIYEWNQYEKFVQVENKEFVVDLGCSKGYFYFKHKDKNIDYLGIDGSTDCLNDFIRNLSKNDNPKLLHTLIGDDKSIHIFKSMFHNNNLQKSLSITFNDLINIINKPIDFLKFDIEGYEKTFLDENYDIFKSKVNKFSGEIHFLGLNFPRKKVYEVLQKISTDNDLVIKLYSLDGIDITESFWANPDYYTEIILSGYSNIFKKL